MTAQADAPHIGLVVEGTGDVNAVPLLLRTHMHSLGDYRDLLGKPVPLHGKGNATTSNGIEGYVTTAAARPGCVGVLVVLDSDGDCVAVQGPALLSRAQQITSKPVVVSLAENSYEDWLYASIETLELADYPKYVASKRGLSVISELLLPKKYVKPTWQPRLTTRMDISMARTRSASLNRLIIYFDKLRTLVP